MAGKENNSHEQEPKEDSQRQKWVETGQRKKALRKTNGIKFPKHCYYMRSRSRTHKHTRRKKWMLKCKTSIRMPKMHRPKAIDDIKTFLGYWLMVSAAILFFVWCFYVHAQRMCIVCQLHKSISQANVEYYCCSSK